MAVSANSANPEKALEVYDLIRNDKEIYRLFNFGIEGVDYVITDDGKLGLPRGLRLLDHVARHRLLVAAAWTNSSSPGPPTRRTRQEIIAELDATAKDYPYSTLLINKDAIDPTLAAMGGVLSEYIPQLQYGKFDDPAAAIAEMRAEAAATSATKTHGVDPGRHGRLEGSTGL